MELNLAIEICRSYNKLSVLYYEKDLRAYSMLSWIFEYLLNEEKLKDNIQFPIKIQIEAIEYIPPYSLRGRVIFSCVQERKFKSYFLFPS